MNISVTDRLNAIGISLDSLSDAVVNTFEAGVVSIAQAARNEWTRLAQERLNTSREIYVNGLRAAESFRVTALATGVKAEITLIGDMPNNFEFGMAAFDMKTVRPGWLGGKKVHHGKNGDYVIIPFRHSKSDNSRFNYTGKAAAVGDLKTQLRAATKKYGLDRALTSAVGEVATRSIPRGAAVHPYLAGLQKTEIAQTNRSGGMSRSSTLTTFRVMSVNSPASSWLHPGLKPANLLQDVDSFVDKEMDRMVDILLGA